MAGKTADNKRIVTQLKKLVKNLPIEVLGHVEAPALCCGSGTVALVKIDTLAVNPASNAKKSVK